MTEREALARDLRDYADNCRGDLSRAVRERLRDAAAMIEAPTPTPEPIPVSDDLLITFAVAFIDGYVEGEPAEFKRHWAHIKTALRRTVPATKDFWPPFTEVLLKREPHLREFPLPLLNNIVQAAEEYYGSKSIAPAPLGEDEMREILAEELEKNGQPGLAMVARKNGKLIGNGPFISVQTIVAAMRRITARNG